MRFRMDFGFRHRSKHKDDVVKAYIEKLEEIEKNLRARDILDSRHTYNGCVEIYKHDGRIANTPAPEIEPLESYIATVFKESQNRAYTLNKAYPPKTSDDIAMDCAHCEYCDGPIMGVPCSRYYECLKRIKNGK